MNIDETLTRETLLRAEENTRPTLIHAYLLAQSANILRCSPRDLSPDLPLINLGISSFMAGELSYLVESDLGVILPLTKFFDGSSLADLTELIVTELRHEKTAPAVEQPPANEFHLSVGQQALWALYQIAPESTAYNIAYAMRIRQTLDLPALQRALELLAQRHPALRTTFIVRHGEPIQQIAPTVDVPLQQEDATQWSESALKQHLAEIAHRPFDLEHGPLFCASLFKRSAQENILLLVVHHIITDFWSLAGLIHELGQLYQSEQKGAPGTGQYADFVSSQADMLAGEKGDQLWAYWQKQLAGELPALDLPTDRPRSPVQTYNGAAQSISLGNETTRRLKAFSQTQGVTLNMTLLAAFQTLLHRYSGQQQVLVGMASSGRSQAAFQHVAGYFVNSLVMRANFESNPSFINILQQVRQTELDALQHQDYPFAMLVKRLNPERDFSRSPLFQAMFIFQQPRLSSEENMVALDLGVDGAQVNIPGLPFESVAVPRWTAQFDLTMSAGEVDNKLAILLKYNTDLFDEDTIARMLLHWQTLIDSLLAAPDQPVSALSLLTSAESHQLVKAWTSSHTSNTAPEMCLPDLFEAQVARTPSAIAVSCEGRSLTYGELNEKSNRLAHHLQSLGIGPEVRVGVCLERSLELVVGVLGTFKAGGVYVPLDPAYPLERLAYMQHDAQLTALVTVSSLTQFLPPLDAPRICLDTDQAILEQKNAENPAPTLASENQAYIIYTSGSTGKPKGVMVPQRAICNHLLWRTSTFPMSADDCFLQLAPLSFDVSVWELFAPLLAGAQLVLPRPGGEKDLGYLSRIIGEQHITHLRFGPSLLSVFLEQSNLEEAQWLKRVFCGGEMLSLDLQERFYESFPNALLYNQYGPTEACVATTYWECEPQSLRSTVPIGHPIANSNIYILDAHLQPVPVGLAGDLYVGGAGLARGYVDRPDLTAACFIPNPFLTVDSSPIDGRLYRTGDRARYTPDGLFEFLGRQDGQVKIRGFRVEVGEVEASLTRHPALTQAIVEAQTERREALFGTASPTQQLVAYLVAKSSDKPTIGELRDFLKKQLPDYMIPSAFVFLEALPLTPNGKVDRKALPALDVSRPTLDGDYEPPRTPVEEVLAEMWAKMLEIERVGIHDSFFELGGHSLLAVQSMALLQDLFGIEEPLVILFFENPTVAGLAAALTESLPGDGNVEKVAEKLRLVMNMSDEEVEAMLMEMDNER